MRILSIDPGLERTGYSIFQKKINQRSEIIYVLSGLIKTSKNKPMELRILEIFTKIKQLINKYQPKRIVLERIFFFKNQKTAIKVSQSQGAILLLAAINKIPVFFLTPLQIKQIITGYGQSDKKAVQKMLSILIKPRKIFKQDDEADAVACGLAYCYLNKKLLK